MRVKLCHLEANQVAEAIGGCGAHLPSRSAPEAQPWLLTSPAGAPTHRERDTSGARATLVH